MTVKDPAPARPKSTGFKVVIDPGHGCMDTGCHSFSGTLLGHEVTLGVANQRKPVLEAKGVEG